MNAPDSGARAELPQRLVAELRALLGDRFSQAAAVREQHGKDESYHRAACRPTRWPSRASTEEVAGDRQGLRARTRCR